MDEKIIVFVDCRSYNHSLYIKETMDGFCMQQTNFPFVCGVYDDASTDGEQDLIIDYLKNNFDLHNAVSREDETEDYIRFFAQHKTNKNCYFVVVLLKYNHWKAKKPKEPYTDEWRNKAIYLAICEGDDYWVDPLKLQKQVDYMESHPNHSLCFCAHKDLFPSGEIIDVFRYQTNNEACPMHDMIMGGGAFMATNSMLWRNSMYVPYSVWIKNSPVGDLPIMLTLANSGLVGYIADVMCVYRRSLAGSWTNRMNSSFKNRYKHYRAINKMWFMFDKYSNYQYHDSIMQKKKQNRKEYLRYEILTPLVKVREYIRRGK